MQIDGACHCGAISFTAEIDPADVSICHCADCQALTGCAYRVTVAAPAASVAIQGAPKIYFKRTAESGAVRRQAFCPTCGTPIYASADTDNPEIYGLRVGAIRQRDQLPPQRQIWRRSAQAWAMNLSALPSEDREA